MRCVKGFGKDLTTTGALIQCKTRTEVWSTGKARVQTTNLTNLGTDLVEVEADLVEMEADLVEIEADLGTWIW